MSELIDEPKPSAKNLVSLESFKNSRVEKSFEATAEVQEALKEISEEGPDGLVAITFQEGVPSIVWVGELELITALGAIEIVKQKLVTDAVANYDVFSEETNTDI